MAALTSGKFGWPSSPDLSKVICLGMPWSGQSRRGPLAKGAPFLGDARGAALMMIAPRVGSQVHRLQPRSCDNLVKLDTPARIKGLQPSYKYARIRSLTRNLALPLPDLMRTTPGVCALLASEATMPAYSSGAVPDGKVPEMQAEKVRGSAALARLCHAKGRAQCSGINRDATSVGQRQGSLELLLAAAGSRILACRRCWHRNDDALFSSSRGLAALSKRGAHVGRGIAPP